MRRRQASRDVVFATLTSTVGSCSLVAAIVLLVCVCCEGMRGLEKGHLGEVFHVFGFFFSNCIVNSSAFIIKKMHHT